QRDKSHTHSFMRRVYKYRVVYGLRGLVFMDLCVCVCVCVAWVCVCVRVCVCAMCVCMCMSDLHWAHSEVRGSRRGRASALWGRAENYITHTHTHTHTHTQHTHT